MNRRSLAIITPDRSIVFFFSELQKQEQHTSHLKLQKVKTPFKSMLTRGGVHAANDLVTHQLNQTSNS
jgi:hypothetical protein